jgi:DNA-binding XRE family transcriptional regulator
MPATSASSVPAPSFSIGRATGFFYLTPLSVTVYNAGMITTASISGIGERIRALRVEAGLTQTDLAKLVGLSQPACVSQYECGRRRPDLDTLARFAKVFSVSLDELCGLQKSRRR